MKNINTTLAVVAALTVVTILPDPAQALSTLADLPPGSQYQLMFVTLGTHDALSSDIIVYNTFVTQQADLNPALPPTTWHVVASTTSVAAGR